jgi:hypothetical protein
VTERRFLCAVAFGLFTLAALVLMLELVFPQPPGSIRPCSLRNRIECKLEEWGIIEPDPFRHVEG